ncbi:alpha-glucosidase-like [Microplitis demolitor]|uniref:alpha-glucosidase-like n=1 Tax=Microplitis demolitor TaxID=69319 RepID=UPI0004400356|nr:alpha-glucosidase-like [Microplitis demolitor]
MWQLLIICLLVPSILTAQEKWWKNSFIYQVYPRSFKDSNGDGVGDLKGITSKLDHLARLGVSGFWISPVFTSPMVDFGYDIANFTDIDPVFGTLADMDVLTKAAHQRGLKVILDFVPNHSSDKHPWFQKSVQRIKPYDEYYIWKDAKMVNGTRQPPNNWLSVFHGSAWTWNEQRKQYYFRQFTPQQPDLNFRSAALRKEMEDVLVFWTNRGIDGFRVDAIIHAYEDSRLLDEPVIPNSGYPADNWNSLNHIYTRNQNETFGLVASWRKILDAQPGDKKILMTESFTGLQEELQYSMNYYRSGSDVPFNFMLLGALNNKSTPLDFKRAIDSWLNYMPASEEANWVIDNHDVNRVSTRIGNARKDHFIMLAAVLPGVGVMYYGNEIGMDDTWLTYNETVDPVGCNAGPGKYQLTSRDPARTPMQWDNSTSAGFSTNPKTWLRVNPNYKTINLASEQNDFRSHFSIFIKLMALKKSGRLVNATTETVVIGDNVLGVVRRPTNSTMRLYALVQNFGSKPVTLDVSAWMNIPERMRILVTNRDWKTFTWNVIDTTALAMPGYGSIVLMPF